MTSITNRTFIRMDAMRQGLSPFTIYERRSGSWGSISMRGSLSYMKAVRPYLCSHWLIDGWIHTEKESHWTGFEPRQEINTKTEKCMEYLHWAVPSQHMPFSWPSQLLSRLPLAMIESAVRSLHGIQAGRVDVSNSRKRKECPGQRLLNEHTQILGLIHADIKGVQTRTKH